MISLLKKFKAILSIEDRKTFLWIMFFMIIGMFFEIFGLGILLPMLKLLLEPEMFNQPNFISDFWHYTDIENKRVFKILCLSILLIVFFLKSTYLVYLNYKQNKFLAHLVAKLSNELYYNYLKQPYSFHLDRNHTTLIKNLQSEANHFYNISQWILGGLIELGFLFALISVLLFIEPIGAISMGAFLIIASLIFFKFSKKKLSTWGEQRATIDTDLSKSLIEGLTGVKDIKVLGKEDYFSNNFSKSNIDKAHVFSNESTSSQLPRYFLEFAALFGLIGFLIVMLLQDKDGTQLMITLGVFVVAIFRIIPSLNKILTAFQKLKFFSTSIDLFFHELNLTRNNFKENKIQLFPFEKSIVVDKLTFSYGEKLVLRNINLEIQKGSKIGIIGPSGSGKSTLIDIIIGLLKPSKGDLIVDKQSIYSNVEGWQKNIGYVSQQINFFDTSIAENIALGVDKEKIDFERVAEVINQAQLSDYISSLKEGVNTIIGDRGVKLSGGQRQRIGIARALYNNPTLLILDEATASLDYETESLFMEAVKNLPKDLTIIMIAHRLTTLSDCDLIYEVINGELTRNESLK